MCTPCNKAIKQKTKIETTYLPCSQYVQTTMQIGTSAGYRHWSVLKIETKKGRTLGIVELCSSDGAATHTDKSKNHNVCSGTSCYEQWLQTAYPFYHRICFVISQKKRTLFFFRISMHFSFGFWFAHVSHLCLWLLLILCRVWTFILIDLSLEWAHIGQVPFMKRVLLIPFCIFPCHKLTYQRFNQT